MACVLFILCWWWFSLSPFIWSCCPLRVYQRSSKAYFFWYLSLELASFTTVHNRHICVRLRYRCRMKSSVLGSNNPGTLLSISFLAAIPRHRCAQNTLAQCGPSIVWTTSCSGSGRLKSKCYCFSIILQARNRSIHVPAQVRKEYTLTQIYTISRATIILEGGGKVISVVCHHSNDAFVGAMATGL